MKNLKYIAAILIAFNGYAFAQEAGSPQSAASSQPSAAPVNSNSQAQPPRNTTVQHGAEVRVGAGFVANTETNTGNGGLGGQAEASVTMPRARTQTGSIPVVISGTIGQVGPSTIGSFAVDVGRPHLAPEAPESTERDVSVATHVGVNATGQVLRVDFLPGLSYGDNHGSTTVGARLPIMGGVIIDRQTGAALLATGVRFDTLMAINPRLTLHAGAEADYLLGGTAPTSAGHMPQSGVYISPTLGLDLRLGDHLHVRAEGIVEGIKYGNRTIANDGSSAQAPDSASLGVTGVLSAAGSF